MDLLKPELFPDCDIVVEFSKLVRLGSFGTFEQTYYEMGSTQSPPCDYKSPTVKKWKVVYTKEVDLESRFDDRVPAYGPVGKNNCLRPGDRPYDRYSMLKYYKNLSVAKKYCYMNSDCDIIVELDRTKGLHTVFINRTLLTIL